MGPGCHGTVPVPFSIFHSPFSQFSLAITLELRVGIAIFRVPQNGGMHALIENRSSDCVMALVDLFALVGGQGKI